MWLLFLSEPGGQRVPGNPDFGGGFAAAVFGFPQIAPQSINDVPCVHGIFMPASYSAESQLRFTEESRQGRMRQFFIYRYLWDVLAVVADPAKIVVTWRYGFRSASHRENVHGEVRPTQIHR
jgi:hypothetical protein